MDIEEKIRELEDELRRTPYNKATQHHIGLLKAKIAKLKDEIEKHEHKSKRGRQFAIKKQGDATVVLLGPPSTGKSSLLNAVTNAESEVGAYEFTTLTVIPGMLMYKGAKIQLLDIPGIISGAHKGRGRGKEIFSVCRSADLLVIMGEDLNGIKETLRELHDAGIRVNKKPVEMKIKKKPYGGLVINSVRQDINKQTLKDMLRAYGIHNAEVTIRQKLDIDQVVDVLQGSKIAYVKGIFVITKSDMKSDEDRKRILEEMPDAIFVSSKTGEGLGQLKEEIFKKLDFIRVYTKKVGKEPDEKPLIVTSGATVEDVCRKIHKEFVKRFQFARVWGNSVRFPGQRVGLEHELKDGDIIELHIRL